MTANLRLFRAITLALGLGLPALIQAAPACVNQDDVGIASAPIMQRPGGTGGTGAKPGGVGGTGIQTENGGVGGTGAPIVQRPGGIGGTGAVAGGVGGTGIRTDNGGVGGTGAPIMQRPGGTGGTGIVGTITGFASICINGVEVHFARDVPVSENGIAATSAQLAVGQVVAMEAVTSQRGLEAGRISILHIYEGPLTALPSASAPLRVMGQPVRLASGAWVAEGLRPGEPVRVSGLRNAHGEVVASRIDRAPGLRDASAIGSIDRTGSLQGLKLSNYPAPAEEVLVRGHWSGRELDVTQSRPDPSLPFIGRAHQAVIEGLVQVRQDRHLVVGGFNVTLEHDAVFVGEQPSELALDQRVRVSGVFSGAREVRATRIEIRHERSDTPARNQPGRVSATDGNADQRADDSGNNKNGRNETDDGSRSDSHHGGDDSRGGIEKLENVEQTEKVERVEKVERPDKVEKVERPERVEKVERPEKVEKVERPEKVERVERPDKVEKVEKVERPERPDKKD
ncbi:MAG: DUF5666 domain-containing protein [Pseudomonas sp.]|nr:DUF5666 domain-containing protein [Pseudomonas sp.]